MVKPKTIIVAETIIHDVTTNKMSVINIHENFNPSGYPLLIPHFTVFMMLERDNNDSTTPSAKLIFKLDEFTIFDQPIEVNFGQGLLTRAVLQFQGFVIPKPGILTITLEVNGESITSYKLPATVGGTPKPHQIM